jgi:hypothetical protein
MTDLVYAIANMGDPQSAVAQFALNDALARTLQRVV